MGAKEGDKLLIVLHTGDEDHGHAARVAFACANASLALDCETTVFLTGNGVHWGIVGEADSFSAIDAPTLRESIQLFLDAGGKILSCSTCLETCRICLKRHDCPMITGIQSGGFTAAITIALEGRSMSF